MIDAITPISASAASPPVNAEKSMSIDSEPDNRYVAWRQAQINAALIATRQATDHEATGDASLRSGEEDVDSLRKRHPGQRTGDQMYHGLADEAAQSEAHTLSGESDHIGTRNFDEETPFGDRTAFI